MAKDTKRRILSLALELFNELGEPNITTNAIAAALEISPGNLHYHFPTKKDIVIALFTDYEQEMLSLLATPPDRAVELDDVWLLLHLSFEVIGRYQFIYRDLTDLCARYPTIHRRFLAIASLARQTASMMLDDLKNAGVMVANRQETESLLDSFLLISHFWLANDRITTKTGQLHPERAVALVMGLISPLLIPEARSHTQHLINQYR